MKRKVLSLLMILALLTSMIPGSFAARRITYNYTTYSVSVNKVLKNELANFPAAVAIYAGFDRAGELSDEGFINLAIGDYCARNQKPMLDRSLVMNYLTVLTDSIKLFKKEGYFKVNSTDTLLPYYAVKIKDFQAYCKTKGWDYNVAKKDWMSIEWYVAQQYCKYASDYSDYGCNVYDIRKFMGKAKEVGVTDIDENGYDTALAATEGFYYAITLEAYGAENLDDLLGQGDPVFVERIMDASAFYYIYHQDALKNRMSSLEDIPDYDTIVPGFAELCRLQYNQIVYEQTGVMPEVIEETGPVYDPDSTPDYMP